MLLYLCIDISREIIMNKIISTGSTKNQIKSLMLKDVRLTNNQKVPSDRFNHFTMKDAY
ncbi:MAG: hypothetical protein GY730_08775, partial [bacterium]|nr:hypothetical protein [bacterium]